MISPKPAEAPAPSNALRPAADLTKRRTLSNLPDSRCRVLGEFSGGAATQSAANNRVRTNGVLIAALDPVGAIALPFSLPCGTRCAAIISLMTPRSDKGSAWRPAALSLTVFGAIARLLPHPPNFAPVGATSVFAGARLPAWQAYLIPLLLMAASDPILDATYGRTFSLSNHLWIWGSFLISVWIGRRLRRTENAGLIAGALFLSALQFFLITNFPSWLSGGLYPRTLAGLGACYTAALPFFGWTLLSELTFGGIFFALHAWLSRSVSVRERVVA